MTILQRLHLLPQHGLICELLIFAMGLNALCPGVMPAKTRIGEIQRIEVGDRDAHSFIQVLGQDISEYYPFLGHGDGQSPPKLFLTFYDVALAAAVERDRSWHSPISRIQANEVSEKPRQVVEIVVDLTGNTPYQIKRINGGIEIQVQHEMTNSVKPTSNVHAVSPSMGNTDTSHSIVEGDSLFISVSPADELSREVVVDQNGKISVPLIGAVDVRGQTTDELGRKIQSLLSQFVTNPKVDVLLRQSQSRQIMILGAVGRAGPLSYRANMHLMDAITQAGGFDSSANKRQVRILRGTEGNRQIHEINVEDMLRTGDMSHDFPLQPGDVIEVHKGNYALTVFGDVMKPGTYDYMNGIRLLDLISLCSGFKDSANARRIRIFRGEPPDQKILIVHFSDVLNGGGSMSANIPLEPGDMIYVPQRPLWTYSNLANTVMPFATLITAVATVILVFKVK